MQHTFTLAAWNFRLARRSLLALWGFLPPSRQRSSCGGPRSRGGRLGAGVPLLRYNAIFCLLGVLPAHRAGSGGWPPQQPPRPQRLYMATLPGTPGQKLAAKAITIAAAELVFAAWQLVWYIVEFYPVTALEGWRRRQMYGAVLPAANFR